MTEHPIDDLAAHALGILEPEEARAVSAHLAGCASCREESAALADTVWRVSETAARPVPARLRAAIVGQARSGVIPAPRTWSSFWSALLRPVPLAVPMGLAALLLIALASLGIARRDVDHYGAALASVVGATVVPLAATDAAPSGIRGSVVVPPDGGRPFLILDLPAAPTGKTWEAWVIRGALPARAGITDDRGVVTLELAAPLTPGDTVAVTAEPSGGVDQPTGAPVLAGRT